MTISNKNFLYYSKIILKRKILVSIISLILMTFSIGYIVLLPSLYTSQAILAQVSSDDTLSNKLGAYSSLANFAGISLPDSSASISQEAVERIKSYDFFLDQFLTNINFENLLMIKDENYGNIGSISNQEAYEIYKDILKISVDSKTSFVSITIDHTSPQIATKWLNLIILEINKLMREIDKDIAKRSINFLNEILETTELTEIKTAISQLLQEQIQIVMFAESSKFYVFKPISSPYVVENKTKPNKFFLVTIAFIFSILFSVFLVLSFYFINSFRKSLSDTHI